MIIAYLRSSSIGTWRMCRHQYFMQYVLGERSPGNKKADLGNMVHKALELLARRRQAEQLGQATLFDPESRTSMDVRDITADRAIRLGWAAYKHLHADFGPEDYRLVEHLVAGVLAGPYDPMKQDVVAPEQFFDLEVPGGWAAWHFKDPHSGEDVRGQLSIKGAMDLVVRDGPRSISYLDWKTGARKDWATGKEKDYDSLMKDPQLLLYYYALRNLYPNEIVTMTIYYCKSGGPYTLPYGDAQYEGAERMLRTFFEEIRDAPASRIKEDPQRNFPCRSFCHYGKSRPPAGSRSRDLCDHHWEAVQQLGHDKVTALRGHPGHSYRYGGGGGVTTRDA